MKTALNWNEDATKANQIAWRKAQDEALPKVEINLAAMLENSRKRQMQKPQQNHSIAASHYSVQLTSTDTTANRSIANS